MVREWIDTTVGEVKRRLAEWFARARIGRKASPHSLRHSFAMRVYGSSNDLLLVQAALRHRSISSSLVYARADIGQLRDVLEKIEI